MKTERIALRAPAEQVAQWRLAAKLKGQTMSAWARDILADAAAKEIREAKITKAKVESIRRQGGALKKLASL